MKKINLIKRLWTDSHEKQKPQRFARYAVMLIMLLTLGVGQMWADSTVNGGYIYFDEYNSGYTGASDMQFWVGHGSHSCSYSMSKVTNTKLWYYSAPSWGDASYFAFTSSASWGCNDQDYYTRIGNSTWKSGKKEGYTINSGSFYVFKVASTANKAAVNSDSPYGYQGTTVSSLNKSQTFKVQVSTDGGSTYTNPATAPATISFSSNTFSNSTTCGTSSTGSFTAGGSTVSLSRNAGYTATTTLTYSSMSSSYTFVCWHDGSSSVGTETTYTYYPTSAQIITARFTKNFTAGEVLYLLRNSTWKNASNLNHYAAYFYGSEGNTWVNCTQVGTSDYYYVTVPSGNWGYVIFVALNNASNNWDNKIYQTDDLMYDSSHNGVEITGESNSQSRITVRTGISVSRNIDAAASAPTITNTQTVVKAGSSVTVNAQTANTGYHWVNWTTSKGSFGTATNRSTTFTPNANSASAVANYALNTQTVTFDKNGGSGTTMSSQVFTYGVAQTLTSNSYTAPTGYHFGGWATSSARAAEGTVDHLNGASITLSPATHGTTYPLYAVWLPNEWTVTLDLDNGDLSGYYGSSVSSVAVTYNSNTNLTSNITDNTLPWVAGDYNFAGYFTGHQGTGTQLIDKDGNWIASAGGGSTYTDGSKNWKYNNDLTLYAKWESRKMLFHESGSAPAGEATGKYATLTYKSTAITNYTAATRTGYSLDGYYTKPNGEGGYKIMTSAPALQYQSQTDTLVNSSGEWIYEGYHQGRLYPHWNANTYTISFNGNDGSLIGTATNLQATVTVHYDNKDFKVGETPVGTVAIPVLSGYTFGGYYTTSECTNTTQVVTAEGAWRTSSLINYMDASGNWKATENKTLYAKWTPKNYTVTYDAGSNGGYILGSAGDKPSTTSSVAMGDTYGSGTASEMYVSAFPTAYRSGYTFDGWYTNVSSGDKVESSTQMNTAANHTLYAHFTQRNYVYFYNNLGWSKVFVTYNAYWSEGDGGTGNYGRTYHEMERIGETNVYRDEIPAAIVADWSGTNGWIAFNDIQLDGGAGVPTDDAQYGNFNSNTKVIHRRDFDSYATMFVPNASATVDFTKMSGGASYYCTGLTADKQDDEDKDYRYINKGYWTRYNDKFTGYVLKGSWDSSHDYYFKRFYSDPEDTSTVTLNLAASTSYTFMIYKHCTTSNLNNSWFSASTRNTTITSSNCTNIVFNTDWAGQYNGSSTNVTITTTTAGDYTFKLATGTDGVLKLSVIYPAALTTDDYRVKYSWNDGSAKTRISETKHMPNINSYPREITMFLHKPSTVTSESLKIQKWNGSAWTDVYTYTDLDDTHVPANGVYVVRINSVAGSTPTGQIREAYTGEYFVRADVTSGGWDHYSSKTFGDNSMRYSAYSLTQTLADPYSHYYCLYVDNTSSSVAYTVATEYSPSICDTLTTDAIVTGSNCHLPATANLRFCWNEQTNALRRAYLKDAQNDNDRFLVLHGKDDDMIFKSNGDAIAAAGNLQKNELQFEDVGNWIYEVDLQAKPGALASITAKYNGSDRYLVGNGSDKWETVLGGTGLDMYSLHGMYDFKTNRLMMMWTPGGEINDNLKDIDMLWVRHAQDAAQQINIGSGSLQDVEVVAAIELRYDSLVGRSATWNGISRRYLKYFISFPFDVNISDIFGLNGASYGNGFKIQKYNGEERAERGYFTLDEGFWQDMLVTDTLKATEGYCLMFDNDYTNNASNSIWEHKSAGSSIYLYFPAADKIASITNADQTESTVASHLYTKDKSWTDEKGNTKSHKDTDSHWNMIGSPLFHNSYIYSSTNDEETPTQLNAYYAYDMNANAWDATPTALTGATGFKAMSAIMVQWHGTVKWNAAATSYTPSAPAARKNKETMNYLAQLSLIYNDEVADNTYVEMKDGADTAFVLCEDLNKITKASKSNVYLFAGNYEVGYSQVPIENVIIPVGVIIRRNGTYTFSMPSNFSGTVTLIDTFDGTRTNLALEDYIVDLQKGTIDERFLLEININNAPTAIDGVTDGEGSLKDGKAHKFIMNGQMYILENGKLYDATGRRVE